MYSRKSLHPSDWTFKGDSEESSEGKENCKESFQLLREYFHNNEHNKGRNMDGKGHSDKVSDRKKEYVIENWRQSNPCYKAAKTLAEMYLCPSVL